MKKAEAISILATSVRPREAKDRARYDEAVKMAIEALKSSEQTVESAQNVQDEDLISKLSEIRSEYNCFDEDEEPYYRALSETIRILSQRADGDTISRQAAIDAIMGQPPEPHYPSWYAAQIEKLPAVQPATNCSEIPNGSDDTISRRAALDMLDEQIELCNKALSAFDISLKDEYAVKVEKASLKAYKEQLENMPSVQPEQRWVPCSERLPEERGFYLTTTKDKAVYCDHWNEDNFDRTEMVIAWMPLPASYKGE